MATVRALFVSGDPDLAARVTEALPPFGVDVVTHDALMSIYPVVVRTQPHVLLLDGALPRLGLEAAGKFLRSKGVSRALPIVAYVPPGEDPLKLAMACSADDFVEMDGNMPALAAALRRVARKAGAFDDVPDTGENQRPVARSDEGLALVLVVDDDPSIGNLLRKILVSKYAVVVVDNGAAAIEECKHKNFAAVFCDLRMPGVSGPDVYRAIAQMNPRLAERVVFVTAHQLDAAEGELFMGLKNQVVHKPFSIREILAAAADVIKD